MQAVGAVTKTVLNRALVGNVVFLAAFHNQETHPQACARWRLAKDACRKAVGLALKKAGNGGLREVIQPLEQPSTICFGTKNAFF
ncbi:hypothetical protein DYI23_07450 [Roseibium polysiphoniae]|uniref:Uncharacterized protein n=1 Tax=Roseibium polysiphoniae TaxID=2571221 RepID=A0A944GRT6_9HYPH|nr:hypothetical protein [Roseibium polysiphoniae]